VCVCLLTKVAVAQLNNNPLHIGTCTPVCTDLLMNSGGHRSDLVVPRTITLPL